MTAWVAWVRHDAGRRWRNALLLTVFVAVAGGVVLSALIGARRDATALVRLSARTHPATAMALPNEPGFDWTPVGELPYVRGMQTFAVAFYTVAEVPDANPDFPRAGPPVGQLELGVPIRGRLADQAAVDEVTISPHMRRAHGIDVGDRLTLVLYAPAVIEAMLSGTEAPPMPPIEVPVRVVGVAKATFFGGDVQPTTAFYEQYRELLTPPGVGYVNAVIALDGGTATLPRLRTDLERLAGRPVEAVDFSWFTTQMNAATRLETASLLAFAAAAAVMTLVLGGIATARSTSASSADVDALRSLGFTRRQTVTAAAAVPAAALVVGAIGATAVAYALSGAYPIGKGRELEPAPGRHANVTVLIAGAVGLAMLGVAGALLAAWRLGREHRIDLETRASHATATYELPRVSLPLAIGARLATSHRRGAGGAAVTGALLCGVVAVVAALTFGAGLHRGTADGTLAGQPFDSVTVRVGAADLPTELVDAWRSDDRVISAARIVDTVTDLDGRSTSVFAVSPLKGEFDAEPLHGRAPEAMGEISLAPVEMRRFGVDIGDRLQLTDGSDLVVVGELFTPVAGHTSYDQGARVTSEQLAAIVASGDPVKFDSLAVDVSDGVTGPELDEVWRGVEHDVGGPVEVQQNLRSARALPRLLALFVAVLAVSAAGYAVFATARRRRREVAVLQVLGLTRRQARAAVGWHVALAAVIALALGVPTGFAIGRTLWQTVADSLPIRYATPTAWVALVSTVGGIALGAALIAARPVRVTARDEPASLLRAE